jgi:hypothetical protein
MDYFISGLSGLKWHDMPIERAEFERIRSSKERLLDIFRTEEKFGLILENYREFEQTLLEITLQRMVFHETDWSGRVSEIYLVARRLVNLLTTSRLYLDQVRHDLGSLYGSDSQQRKDFDDWTHIEYDGRLGYRIMEALRNYVQHRSIPVTTLSVGWQRRELPSGEFGVHTANPKLDVNSLIEEGGFKASVLEELKNLPEFQQQRGDVPIKMYVRQYVEGLASVHQKLQELLHPEVPTHEAVLAGVRDRFLAEAPGDVKGLSVVARGDDGASERHEHLS